MLSIRDELLKLAPVNAQRANGDEQSPPLDTVGQWQEIATRINDVSTGQRKAVEQLEAFLAAVRSAAAETQRTAAATQSFLEEQRALIAKDRAAQTNSTAVLEPLIARLDEQQRAATAEVQALVQAAGMASIERDRALEIHLRSGRRELEAVIEPLASAALDFREIAVGLSSLLSKVEALSGSVQSNAELVRSAVSEELLHRHEELERLRLEIEKSGAEVTTRITAAIASLDQATHRHAEALAAEQTKRQDAAASALASTLTATIQAKLGELSTTSVATIEARLAGMSTASVATIEAKLAEIAIRDGAAHAELKSLRKELESARAAEQRAKEEAEQRDEQLRATSASMMAFLEALDDLSGLRTADADSAAQKIMGRVTTRAQRVLAAAGLSEIDALGGELNEDLHEVVEKIPASAELPAGRVSKVVQRGFRSGDRVLRRAQVIATS